MRRSRSLKQQESVPAVTTTTWTTIEQEWGAQIHLSCVTGTSASNIFERPPTTRRNSRWSRPDASLIGQIYTGLTEPHATFRAII
eukprot:5339656-Prymnesium_polylepis.1